MAKNDFESSPESGQPVSLFLFRFGPGASDVVGYTDAEQDVVHDSITYSALYPPGLEDEIVSKQMLTSTDLKITMHKDSPIASMFREYPPEQVVSLTIREGHIPNDDDPVPWATGENFPVVWIGRVLEAERQEDEVRIVCDDSAASMRRPGLRRSYQRNCPHALYRGRCGATKSAFQSATTVASIAGNRVTLDTPWLFSGRDVSDYQRGRIEWAGSLGTIYRTILRVTDTNTLILNGPATDLSVSDSVDLFIGCTRTISYCALHNAVPSFGGFIGMPKSNPTGKNNHT